MTSCKIRNSSHVLLGQRVIDVVETLEEFQNSWTDITCIAVIFLSYHHDRILILKGFLFSGKSYSVRLLASALAQILNSTLLSPGSDGIPTNSDTKNATRYVDIVTEVS